MHRSTPDNSIKSLAHQHPDCSSSIQLKVPYHSRPAVLLGTGQALLITPVASVNVRLLIDPGSELSFVSEHLIKRCQLIRRYSSVTITGIGGNSVQNTKGVTTITLQSQYSNEKVSIDTYILKQLTTTLPSVTTYSKDWPHLNSLQLADQDYMIPRSVDIIIGADSYGQIIKEKLIKSTPDAPIAQLTIFGWIILGPINPQQATTHQSYHTTANSSDQNLQHLLTQFWIQEEIPTTTV